MYDKIKTTLARAIAVFNTFYEKYGKEVEEVCGVTKDEVNGWDDQTSLDVLIGDSSIHGWLANKIDETELREGKIIQALVGKYGEEGKELVLEGAYWHGKGKGIEATENAQPSTIGDMFGIVHANLLDGMPCDQVAEHSESNGSIVSKHSDCLHLDNWKKAGVDSEFMCAYTRNWIDGLCESINEKFQHTAGENVITGSNECVDTYNLKS